MRVLPHHHARPMRVLPHHHVGPHEDPPRRLPEVRPRRDACRRLPEVRPFGHPRGRLLAHRGERGPSSGRSGARSRAVPSPASRTLDLSSRPAARRPGSVPLDLSSRTAARRPGSVPLDLSSRTAARRPGSVPLDLSSRTAARRPGSVPLDLSSRTAARRPGSVPLDPVLPGQPGEPRAAGRAPAPLVACRRGADSGAGSSPDAAAPRGRGLRGERLARCRRAPGPRARRRHRARARGRAARGRGHRHRRAPALAGGPRGPRGCAGAGFAPARRRADPS
jgi:hypothetical protein